MVFLEKIVKDKIVRDYANKTVRPTIKCTAEAETSGDRRIESARHKTIVCR